MISLQFDKRRWLPEEEFTARLWVVNDLYCDFEACTAEVKFLDADKKVVHEQEIAISFIAGDSAQGYADVAGPVPGQLGDRFFVSLALRDAVGVIRSENEYLLLVADQDKEINRIREIGQEAIDIKQKYGWANYFRYFPDIDKADEKMPIAAGFDKTTHTNMGAEHEQ